MHTSPPPPPAQPVEALYPQPFIDYLERSLQAARRAVQIDPDNTRGLQALMTALFFNGQPVDSLRVGEQALAVNPNDTELLSEFGTRLAMSGQWERGLFALIREHHAIFEQLPAYAHEALVSAHLRNGTRQGYRPGVLETYLAPWLGANSMQQLIAGLLKLPCRRVDCAGIGDVELDADLRHALNLRQTLRNHRFGVIVNLG